MIRHFKKKSKNQGQRLIVVGAGAAGQQVVSQIRKEKLASISVVGFVDDDPKKQGKVISSIRVLGTIDALPRIVKMERIDQILISTPSIGRELTERVTKLLPLGFPIQILPSISSVLLGKVNLSSIRDIDPSDFIGRPLVKSNQVRISKEVKGKTFLVTGGAGSIGSEIVRQLSVSGAKRVIVLDSWEEGIFNLLEEIKSKDASQKGNIEAYLGNIRDRARIDEIFKLFKIDVVVHAAAYKHVPLLEDNSGEAEKTNYGGTKNILDAAIKYKVKDFVLISTDKAVNPINVLGRTKREAELLMKKYAKKYPEFRFSAVRFGNVLNSSGSVLPKFVKQIRSRSAVTITHLEMTRYFMAIPEAVSLVLMAWIIAKHGQILVLDMGEPVKILDLAIHLIKSEGLEPYRDILIQETGIRKGEKIHEELSYSRYGLRPSSVPRVFIAEEA